MTAQVEKFIASLIAGAEVRDEFSRAPRQTAERAGVALSDDDLAALRTVDWGDDALLAGVGGRNAMSQCTPTSDVNAKENIVAIRWG